jgi:chromosome segregation ATPase
MARSGVTYTEVAKAAETVKQQGFEPTVDRVREKLGTGSKSTIGPHLKQWKSANLGEGAIPGLPDELLKVVKSLHESILGEAELTINEAKTELNAVIEDLKDKLTAAQQQNGELASNNEQLTQQNQELTNQLETTNKDHLILQLKQEQLEQDVKRLNAELAEEKQNAKQLQANLEYYQEKTAEDRQQERNQHQLAQQQSQNYIDQLTNQLSVLQEQKEESSVAVSNLEKENLTLQQKLNEKINKNEELNASLVYKTSEVGKLIEKKQKIQDDYSSVFAEKSAAEKAVEHLSVTLRKTEEDVSVLRAENKVILNEKAIAEGQLKQLITPGS